MDQSTMMITFKMLLSLAAVLALFGGSVWALKKFGMTSLGSKLKKNKRGQLIDVLGYHSLGPSRGVYLIECEGKKFLVGSTSQNISFSSEIDSDETDEEYTFDNALSGSSRQQGGYGLGKEIKSSLKEISRV